MNKTHEQIIENAIKDAVEAAVLDLGIDFVRTLSMFPSSIAEAKGSTAIAA